MESSSIRQRQRWILYGMLLGAACFILIYGINVLDFTNDSWIMHTKDPDIKQHYLGWCHFRNSDWGFPIGMMNSLSYPYNMSVIYTDSIPLFAVFFKLFRAFLPETFQYLGLFGLLSFALTGGVSALLLRRFTKNSICALVGTVFFVVSPVMLRRMFYHTSLSAQWIILLSIYYLLDGIAYKTKFEQKDVWRRLGLICVLIHIYFVPIVALIMVGASFERFIHDEKKWKTVKLLISNIISFSVPALIVLFVLGAFSIPSGNTNYAVGEFGANLNTFINPLGMSVFLPNLPVYTEFQYEGSAYLGLGMMLMILALLVIYGVYIFKGLINTKNILSGHWMRITVLLLCVAFMFFAISPVFSFGSNNIFTIPYSNKLLLLFGIFRSNGRFIWPVMYFVYLCVFRAISEIKAPAWAAVVLVIAGAFIQMLDLSGVITQKRDAYAGYLEPYNNLWDVKVGDRLSNYDGFVFFDISMNTFQNIAYYAYENGMNMNRFYFARDIDKQVEENLDIYRNELKEGILRENQIYVMYKDNYYTYKDCGLHFYRVKYMVIGTKDPIGGMEEITDDDLIEMGWE